MRKILLPAALWIAIASALMGQAAPFSGKWQWKHGQEALTLNLRQSGSRLTGWHAAIGQGGLRVDEAAPDQPPSIEGMINGETAEVTFRSTYPGSSAHGHATLKLRGGALYWHVVDTDGEEYLPDSARLTRR